MPLLPKPSRKAYLPERKRKPTGDQRFYNSAAWRKTSKLLRQRNPLCEVCSASGVMAAANVVDHLIGRQFGGADYDPRNLMAMCSGCHDRKSGLEAHGLPLDAIDTPKGLVPYDRSEVFALLTG